MERKSETETPLVLLNPWTSPYFQKFWRSYYSSQKWCKKHWSVSCSLRCHYGLPFLPPPPPPPPIHCPHKTRRGSKVKKLQDKNSEEEAGMEIEPSNDFDENDVEINAEFVEFLATSIRHRMERDKEKTGKSNDQSSWFANLDEYIPVDKIGVNRRVVGLAESILPPTEIQGEERSREMKTLYGPNAERIQAMESLMQVQFDIDFDRLNPPLWPNMPFKL